MFEKVFQNSAPLLFVWKITEKVPEAFVLKSSQLLQQNGSLLLSLLPFIVNNEAKHFKKTSPTLQTTDGRIQDAAFRKLLYHWITLQHQYRPKWIRG